MKYSSLPIDQLQTWARFNGVKLHGVEVRSHIYSHDGTDKGGGLVATQDLQPAAVLVSVPEELVLTKTSVKETAKMNQSLRELLAATSSTTFEDSRTVIMLFLLLQLTLSGSEPLTDYVKLLPKEIPLPTFYSSKQKEAIVGTSLEAALSQKLQRLESEFACLKSSTEHIEWCHELWWADEDAGLTLEDWKLVDAMYRSRAFELPRGKGECMTPVLDMVNHASNDAHNARFEVDDNGNVQLLVRDDVSIRKGEEITIIYGSGGACETVFSYGFLEPEAQSAREIFLDLRIPDDDPLKAVKMSFAGVAPGVRIYADHQEQIKWESSIVWWACLNEEDGLEFHMLQTNDGSRELRATFKDKEFEPGQLEAMLKDDPAFDIFLLRALILIQNAVEYQGGQLAQTENDVHTTIDMIKHLQKLELDLLGASYQALETEKLRLLESDVVRAYLDPARSTRSGGEDDDFS